MRKQEFVHLHALCVAVRVHLEDHHDAPPDAFRSYDDHHVSPSAINRRKAAHEAALFSILDGLASAVDDLPASSDDPSSPLNAP